MQDTVTPLQTFRSILLANQSITEDRQIASLKVELTTWLDKFIRVLREDSSQLEHLKNFALKKRIQTVLHQPITTETQEQNAIELKELITADLLLQVHEENRKTPGTEAIAANYLGRIFAQLPTAYTETSLKRAFGYADNLEEKEFILDTLTGPMASSIKTDEEFIEGVLEFIKQSKKNNSEFKWQKYFLALKNIPFNMNLYLLAIKELVPLTSTEQNPAKTDIYNILAKFTEINFNERLLNLLIRDSQQSPQNREKISRILSSMKPIPDNQLPVIRENFPGLLADTCVPLRGIKYDFQQRCTKLKEPNTMDQETIVNELKPFALALCRNSSFYNLDFTSLNLSEEQVKEAKLLRTQLKLSNSTIENLETAISQSVKSLLGLYLRAGAKEIRRELGQVLMIFGEDIFSELEALLTGRCTEIELNPQRINLILNIFNSLLEGDFGKEMMRIYQSRNPEAFTNETYLFKPFQDQLKQSNNQYDTLQKFLKVNGVDINFDPGF